MNLEIDIVGDGKVERQDGGDRCIKTNHYCMYKVNQCNMVRVMHAPIGNKVCKYLNLLQVVMLESSL